MKRKRYVLAILLGLVLLTTGCFRPVSFFVAVEPLSGHPPLTVTIRLQGGVTFFIEIGLVTNGVFDVDWSFHSSQTKETVVLYELPKDIRIIDENGQSKPPFHIALENEPPVIHWPLVNGIPAWYDGSGLGGSHGCILHERQRYFCDFTQRQSTPNWPGDLVELYGIHDPEKDKCQITNVKVLWYGDGFPNGREVTVYTPPYEEGVYHAVLPVGSRSPNDIVENAFVLYPPYLGHLTQTSSRVTCPFPEWTYFCSPCEDTTVPFSDIAPLTIKVEAEDEHGAHAEETFEFTMDATGCAI